MEKLIFLLTIYKHHEGRDHLLVLGISLVPILRLLSSGQITNTFWKGYMDGMTGWQTDLDFSILG